MTEAVRLPAKRSANVQARDPSSLMGALIKTISDPQFDVEKLKQLREVYKEELQDQRRAAFNEAMVKCRGEMPVIKANKKNPDTHSLYASLDAVDRVVSPIIAKHGFFVSFNMGDGAPEGHYRIVALVGHTGGFERTYQADFPADMKGKGGTTNKTAIHGMASTMSYAQRYMLKFIFNLSIEGEDKDANQPGAVITEEQVAELRKLLADAHIKEAEFLEGRYDNLEDIPTRKFDSAKRVILQATARRGGK